MEELRASFDEIEQEKGEKDQMLARLNEDRKVKDSYITSLEE